MLKLNSKIMTVRSILGVLFFLLYIIYPSISECPNACSSHGRCGAYDMCKCYRNFMADDCSQRLCPFGLAHGEVISFYIFGLLLTVYSLL